MANGNTYDARRRMLSCEHRTSRVTRTELDGSIAVLADRYDGKELNCPNDIVDSSDEPIFFTDPTYGRMPYYGVERQCDLDFRGVYRMDEDGSNLMVLANDFAQPNGLCFSRDESRLFVNDTDRGYIRAFTMTEEGRALDGDVWTEVGGEGEGAPDGLKADSHGKIYCRGPGGLHVFAPDARCLGAIRVPEVVANFTWGGEDLRSFFLMASTSLCHVRTNTPGMALF